MASDLVPFKPILPSSEQPRKKLSSEEVRAKYRRPATEPPRILLAVDGTGSMESFWTQVAMTISDIIKRTLAVGNGVVMKIVAYRDHCDGERIIEASSWNPHVSELQQFISTIRCDGGGDAPEAVDRALQIALQEQTLSRVILIGDAPPHLEQDCTTEASRLGQMSRPVFPIVVGQDPETRAAFQRIAKLSGGKLIDLTNIDELFEFISILATHAMGAEAMKKYTSLYQHQLSAPFQKCL